MSSILNKNYRVSPGQHGTSVIEETGRCHASERADIEADICRRYQLIPYPNAAGVVLKALDGSNPQIQQIRPTTFSGDKFKCVKVEGYCNPFAPEQTGGTHNGKAILAYYIRWQQVGDIA
jgi:hypothetical protein